MCRISILSSKGIPEKNWEELHKCVFCGEEYIRIGGAWSGNKDIAVCSNCINQLADLIIDTISDTIDFKKIGHDKRKKFINNLIENRLMKKQINGEFYLHKNNEFHLYNDDCLFE